MDVLRAHSQVELVRLRGKSAIHAGAFGNLQGRHEETAERLCVFQIQLHIEVLLYIVFLAVFSELFAVARPHREVYERIAEFVEHRHQVSEVHQAGHLEIEEVTVDIDAPLQQVVVEDGGSEIVHRIAATTVFIDCGFEIQRAFKVVDVESGHVGHDMGAHLANAVILHQIQGAQVGMFDDRLEVGLGMLLVLEINQTIEVKEQVVIVNPYLTFKPVLLQVTVKFHLVDMVAEQLRIGHHTIDHELGTAFFREFGSEVGVHVEVTYKLGDVSHLASLHILGVDIAREHIVALAIFGASDGCIDVANA